MRSTVLPLSSLYREAVFFTLRQQVPCALLCLLLLDGGRMAKVCGIAMLGFWSAAALIMARRPRSPGAHDVLFLRWGFLPLFALTASVAQLARPH
jgi:hypothetical protein